jgi:dTDP-4-dehydrorhamnose reductase
MDKVLVIGKSGQLAHALQELVDTSNWTYLSRDELNLLHTETIPDVLKEYEFNILVNAAAYTAVDKAEEEIGFANTINHVAVAELAKVCEHKNAVLIHISTDYVFHSNSAKPLKEEDPVNPQSVYGKSKLEGEEAIQRICPRHFILRTSWLYGPNGKNFLKTMLKLGKERDALSVVIDQLGSPTYVNDLARAIIDITKSPKCFLPENWGIYHFSNEGVASWYDFAHAIFELAEIQVELNPISTESFPTPAKRPPYSVMSKEKIKNTFGVKINHWRDALRECLHNMN